MPPPEKLKVQLWPITVSAEGKSALWLVIPVSVLLIALAWRIVS
jgi:hypothetical protein